MTFLERTLAITVGTTATFAIANHIQAEEVKIGDPVQRNGLEVGAVYLEAIEMVPTPPTSIGADTIHLECDVTATENNQQGFSKGAWVPYLSCIYHIEKVGSDWERSGQMLPMVAQDGPHYANNIPMDGPGKYRLTYQLAPPSSQGFFRHADEKTGVADWWDPFSVQWTFEYPSPEMNKGKN